MRSAAAAAGSPPPRRRPAATCWLASAALLVLCALPTPAAAIYEDQVGTYDWYKLYVGRPLAAAFLPGKERVFVSTSQQLLASLSAQSGSVVWRRAHTQPDGLDAMLAVQAPTGLVLAASSGGKLLRAWDALEGSFRWEAVVYEGPPAAGGSCGLAAVQLQGGGSQGVAVAVAAGDTAKLLGAAKGDQLWSASLTDATAAATHKLVAADGDGVTVTVAAFSPGDAEVHVTTFAAADGSVAAPTRSLAAAAPLSSSAATSGSSIAILTADGRQLCTTAGAASGLSCQQLDSLAAGLAAAGPADLRLAPAAAGSFTLASPAGVALIGVGQDGSASLVKLFADAAAASPAAALAAASGSSGAGLLALASSAEDGSSVRVQLADAASGDVVEAAEVAVPPPAYATAGPPARVVGVWLDASKRKQQASSSSTLAGCRLLVLWSDDRLSFVERGEEAWAREEALAAGTSSLMIDLPAAARADQASDAGADADADSASTAAAGGKKGGVLGLLQDKEAFKLWVRLQVLSVLIQFKLNTDFEREEFLQLRKALSDNNLPFRDTNGFRKLIVLLTAPGKVFALHSGDGRIMWTSTAAAAVGQAGGSGQQQQYLRLWRRFHDLTHAPQIAVLSAGQARGGVRVLNGHTGQQLQELELAYGVDKVIPLHAPVHDGAAEQFSFLLVEPRAAPAGALPRVHLLPDTPATRSALASKSSNTFFWLQEQQAAAAGEASTALQGYSLAPQAVPDSAGGLPVVPAWRVELPGRLLATAARDPTEPIYSYVKVLGDRSLKYKFVNPNLLFVATATGGAATAGPDEAPSASSDGTGVSVALLNTVTGSVVHQQAHAGATGPVHAVLSEHWVVYTLWDAASMRQQVTVIEFYDASLRDLSIASILSGATKHADALSSYASMRLEVLSQSFYLQHAVKGLSVSQTLQGITTKQVLLHTITDQLYALDKRWLDPRRPLAAKATPEQAEEGLMPYNELIIFNTLAYASHDKQVANLRGVVSAPAVLESNSLLFAYGSELFYTRITPAAHFDSLAPDFSYGLLVVAIAALSVATWFTKYSSEQAMLKAKWE